VKKAGIWEEVSRLDIGALERLWEEREEDARLERALKGFISRVEEEAVRFVKVDH
jgi:hypothetical protein